MKLIMLTLTKDDGDDNEYNENNHKEEGDDITRPLSGVESGENIMRALP